MSQPPPKYKLTYFNLMGRGELARLCFAVGGEKYEDHRIEFKDWPEQKQYAPQGVLPYLTINGEKTVTVSQSTAIYRYLAREFSLYGTSSMEALYIDEIVDTAMELCIKGAPMHHEPDDIKKAEMFAKFYSEAAPKCFDILEKLVTERGTGDFAVGSKLSLADLEILAAIDFMGIKDELLANYPKLKTIKENTAADTKIAAWLKSRPPTAF